MAELNPTMLQNHVTGSGSATAEMHWSVSSLVWCKRCSDDCSLVQKLSVATMFIICSSIFVAVLCMAEGLNTASIFWLVVNALVFAVMAVVVLYRAIYYQKYVFEEAPAIQLAVYDDRIY